MLTVQFIITVTLLEGGQQKLQRLAVPASQVFPQFIKLAETWRGFQEETIILSRLDSLRRLLYDYLFSCTPVLNFIEI